MDIQVQNIVASVVTGEIFDLNMISSNLVGSEYSKEKFPGLIYKLKDPKTAILVFTSGKLVVTGAKTVEKVYEAVDKFRGKLEDIGVKVKEDPKITIQNIQYTPRITVNNMLATPKIAIPWIQRKTSFSPSISSLPL